jgi:hypothetical protein
VTVERLLAWYRLTSSVGAVAIGTTGAQSAAVAILVTIQP